MGVERTVSVVIPTYYRNQYLRGAIESVREQTYDPVELIVVDDSGEGHARSVVEQFEDLRYIEHEVNRGTMSAWHTGLNAANGEFVQILDDDDRLFERKLEKQVRLFETSPEVGAVHCGMEWEFGVRRHPNPHLEGDVLDAVLTLDTSPCVTSTILMRAEVLNEILPLPTYDGAIDDVLKIELAQVTEFDLVDEPLVLRGEIEGSISNSMRPVRARWRIIDEYADLYDQAPSRVRQRAVSSTYVSQGFALLAEHRWSFDALRSFWLGAYLSPSFDGRNLSLAVLSTFGRPGVETGDRIARSLAKRLD